MTTLAWPIFQGATTEELKATGRSTQNYVTLPIALSSIEQVTKKVFDAFVSKVESILSVEQVRAQAAGTYLHLVVYVSDSTREERFRIYEIEQIIHDDYPSLSFEFDLIDRRGYPMQEGHIEGKYIKTIRQRPDSSTHEISKASAS